MSTSGASYRSRRKWSIQGLNDVIIHDFAAKNLVKIKGVKSLIFEGKIVIQYFAEENLVKKKGVKNLCGKSVYVLDFAMIKHDLDE